MIDIKFLRENPEVVKENIRKKYQDEKLPLVDEVIALDTESRKAKQEADDLRASRNRISKEIGALMGQGKKEEAEAKKAEVAAGAKRLAELEASETELQEKITKIMMVIPNIIDESVPIGKDDSQNVEIEKFGEPIVPDFEVPYHADILDRLNYGTAGGYTHAHHHTVQKQCHGTSRCCHSDRSPQSLKQPVASHPQQSNMQP